uniref:Uncharacterized protein n=1 Tax=Desertifilum tharense IPPAS B-1220 TaxID=1781255 RepID=A0ACD5GPG8_9CYAN
MIRARVTSLKEYSTQTKYLEKPVQTAKIFRANSASLLSHFDTLTLTGYSLEVQFPKV